MTKEEFLAMSLPYELYIQNGKEADKVVGIVGDSIMTLFRGHLDNVWHIDDAKPILRPLTDLTKPITQKGYNNGEPFVPIVELAKIIYPNHEWRLSGGSLPFAIVGNGYMTFEYDSGYNVFLCNNSAYLDQLKCFLKIISWHFNLMDEGEEFVDVNTLDINPYI